MPKYDIDKEIAALEEALEMMKKIGLSTPDVENELRKKLSKLCKERDEARFKN